MGNSNGAVYAHQERRANKSDEIFQQNFVEIRKRCLQNGVLFEDDLFPPNSSSLLFENSRAVNTDVAVKWLRPKEICESPEFFVDESSRFDLVQGDLGDCWVVAALATLADHKQLLQHVVPEGQNFKNGTYAGIFVFRIFYFGKWVEICIDDRLPTVDKKLVLVRSSQSNEFWGALIEKAYAKLFGCYEAIQGGVSSDSLSDFTGGIVETYRLKNDANENMAKMLVEAVRRGCLICAGIWGDSSKNPILNTGLVAGHAYTVVDAESITFNKNVITLVKIRNPWANYVEWSGPWSDKSPLWDQISVEEKNKLQQKIKEDGEFWMSAIDFVTNFDDLDICNLTPDSVESDLLIKWNTITFYGSWIKGSTAGGRLKYKTFAINPQFVVDLVDSNEDNLSGIVVELSQRLQRNRPGDNLDIGFLIYKISDDATVPVTNRFFDENPRAGGVDYFTNLRTVTKRFSLKPGKYLIICSTWDPGQEGEFLLRIWSESQLNASNETTTETPAFNGTKNDNAKVVPKSKHLAAIDLFKATAGVDLQVDAFDLMNGLNHLYATSEKYYIDIDCCKSMIFLFDVGGHYKLNLEQFRNLFQILDSWTMKFISYDTQNVGNLNFSSYTICLAELNLVDLNKKLLNYLLFAYFESSGKVSYSNYIRSLIKLSTINMLETGFGFGSSLNSDSTIVKSDFRSALLKF